MLKMQAKTRADNGLGTETDEQELTAGRVTCLERKSP
jgi:hypothetical protein